ncbi:hypothetical protein Tdes44962_MAKER06073 [Teratosphaeria destructans]|uniref:Uncharacterized protein n=1 Tax=Teratosphaeria destructans TaxID=418781 RepID=A0A9W7SI71_9PEZI|nr:hypothetical protein Tdes44962_MAKER06073 [Teratosphaeria destructans]
MYSVVVGPRRTVIDPEASCPIEVDDEADEHPRVVAVVWTDEPGTWVSPLANDMLQEESHVRDGRAPEASDSPTSSLHRALPPTYENNHALRMFIRSLLGIPVLDPDGVGVLG